MLKAKRLLFASLVMLFFLPLASTFDSNPNSIGPYNSVALAGRTVMGSFCECGCPGCMCDPEEQAGNCGYGAVARSSPSDVTSKDASQENAFDPAAGLMILAALFFFWARFRT